ncbi:hypothetical protein ZYGR_0AD04690 [Zygosaccharomyces rouxii]|uniref:HDA1 complex subunit 2 n=1 Tax=Zygosaccharomyces rouxii TaxID=4956 RepID=A0A1Q3A6C1_ZYGRO|nr:hypothetical protein ZYGR_0AD04690 [Zygosaccharomyces rouxii]
MNRNARNSHVFYLPVGLTPFQRDLTEILVSLHARSFQKELDSSNNIDDKDAVAEYPQISSKQMTHMLDKGIRVVANHPCLLVEHYMPRQFLRMVPTENLVTTSDKFQKLQELLSRFIQRDRQTFPDALKICIISHNVRELDILEGLVLGKRVRIKRLSGASLYDEKHVFPLERSCSPVDASNSKDGTPSNESGSNRYTGYHRDDYDYSLKHKMKSVQAIDEDWLFLTTTTHLTNNPELMRGYNVDYIISFDPSIDPFLPALDNIRKKGQKRLPLVKLLVKDSPDHFLLENPPTEGTDNYQHSKAAIKHFLSTRHTTYNNLPSVDYKQVVDMLLRGENTIPSLSEIPLSQVSTDVPPFELIMTRLDFSDNQLTMNEDVFDMKSYQSELNKRTLDRLLKVQNECRHGDEILTRKRHYETDRQDYLDETRVEAGNVFKKFQDGEKSIIDSEKRLERCKSEASKLDDKIKALDGALEEAKRITLLADVDPELQQYTEKISTLKTLLGSLSEQNLQRNQHNDSLRSQYQQKSSEAAEQSQRTKVLKDEVDQLHKDLEGPGLQIQTKTLLSQEQKLKNDLASLKSRSKFLKSYVTKMASYYGLKPSSSDDSLSNGTHGQNGRSNARYRSTRSNTPAYT